MINNRSLPPPLTTQLDHFTSTTTTSTTSSSSPVPLTTQFNAAMATANAIAASINAQSLHKTQATTNSPKETTMSPVVVANSSQSPIKPVQAIPESVQQPLVHVSLAIQLFEPEKLYPTPSMADDLAFETEFDLRLVGCELIQTAGRLLKLPQTAMATGQVLFHRYFYIKSFVKNPMEFYAMAAIFLSSKIEECPRRIRDVMNVFHHMKQVRSGKVIKPMSVDETYYDTKNQVIKAERRMLKELGFCIHVKHPHKIIFIYLQAMECTQLELSQKAWNFMNDSLRTDIFLRYTPENIVCACIYLAARELKIPLPQSPPWFTIFGADEESLKEICVRILHLYSHKTKTQDELEKIIAECNEKINEEKRRTREAKCKSAAVNVAAAITSSELSKKGETVEDSKKDDETKALKTKLTIDPAERKFPHQHRSSINTPPDHTLPVLSHSNPYYLNHHHGQAHLQPTTGHPISRHSSFTHPYNYPHYANGNGMPYPDHYQNENYYDSHIRKNKSSNDLIGSHYKETEEYRYHKERKHSRDRSRTRIEVKEEHSRSKISNQTNRIDIDRSKSRTRSRSPWKKERALDRKNRGHKHVSRSRSRSIDSMDSEHSKSSSSAKHKKKKHHSSSSHRKEERGSKDRERRDRDRERSSRDRSHHRHHKSSKSSKSRGKEHHEGTGESSRYVPIYS